MFVTVFYGILNTRTGEFQYSNAGHNIPYLLDGQGAVTQLENPGGMALGVMEELRYRVHTIRLRPGDGLFLYTDGITEAMDPEGNLFSNPRLETLLERLNRAGSAELVRATVAAVQAYAAGAPQADDITLLVLRYLQGNLG